MSGLSAFVNSVSKGKYFPFKNATPRSSVSLQLLYDLGVLGSNNVAGVGDIGALEAQIKALEAKLDAIQTELDDFTAGTNYKCDQLAIATQQQRKDIDQNKTDLALHVNNGEHWTGQAIDDRINAIVNP